MAVVANAGVSHDLFDITFALLYCFAESFVRLLRPALAIWAYPESFLLRATGALDTTQSWRAIMKLPHRRSEVYVAFELGAGSTALAIAVVAHSGAFFQ